jgi:hypothetical protein
VGDLFLFPGITPIQEYRKYWADKDKKYGRIVPRPGEPGYLGSGRISAAPAQLQTSAGNAATRSRGMGRVNNAANRSARIFTQAGQGQAMERVAPPFTRTSTQMTGRVAPSYGQASTQMRGRMHTPAQGSARIPTQAGRGQVVGRIASFFTQASTQGSASISTEVGQGQVVGRMASSSTQAFIKVEPNMNTPANGSAGISTQAVQGQVTGRSQVARWVNPSSQVSITCIPLTW